MRCYALRLRLVVLFLRFLYVLLRFPPKPDDIDPMGLLARVPVPNVVLVAEGGKLRRLAWPALLSLGGVLPDLEYDCKCVGNIPCLWATRAFSRLRVPLGTTGFSVIDFAAACKAAAFSGPLADAIGF